jgi:hypothetical protein
VERLLVLPLAQLHPPFHASRLDHLPHGENVQVLKVVAVPHGGGELAEVLVVPVLAAVTAGHGSLLVERWEDVAFRVLLVAAVCVADVEDVLR